MMDRRGDRDYCRIGYYLGLSLVSLQAEEIYKKKRLSLILALSIQATVLPLTTLKTSLSLSFSLYLCVSIFAYI